MAHKMVFHQNISLVCLILTVIFLKITPISSIQYGSLTFVIDTTASMEDEIQKVKEATAAIYEAIATDTSQIRDVVLVTFNDPCYQSETGKWYCKNMNRTDLMLKDETKSPENLENVLRKIKVNGGGDCPEYSMAGMELALHSSLQNSFLFVFTDAPPKDFNRKDIVIKSAQARGSQIFFFITKARYCHQKASDFEYYYETAMATNGQVFLMISKKQIEQILNFLMLIVSGEGNVIKSPTVIRPHQLATISFTVDDQTEYIVVSASGSDLKLRITAGHYEHYESIVWEKNVKILKINNPLPGSYEVSVKGSSSTTVMIFGRTDFTFQHGFAEDVPPTFRDDVKQPTDGSRHHLLVNVADPSQSVNIKAAEILNMDEEVLEKLLLRRVSQEYYKTDLFMPPSYPTMFKIRVIGEGKKTGKTLTRTAKTPIQARLRKFDPEIQVHGGGTYKFNDKVTLTCSVKAHPKPTISWKNEKGYQKQAEQKQISKYEYVSEIIIDAKKTTAYSCYAINDYGEKSKWVEINVESPFIIQDKPNGVLYADYDKPALLNCNIKSLHPMKINWYYINNHKKEMIKDSNAMSVTNEGRVLRINKVETETLYFCVASIISDPDITHTIEIGIEINHHAPVMAKSEEWHVNENDDVVFECKILEAFPKPKIQWQFKKPDTAEFQTISDAPYSQKPYIIKHVDLSHVGTYRCIAKNDEGANHYDVKIVVQIKPKATVLVDGDELSKKEINYGDDVTFTCRVISLPIPYIVWRDSKKQIVTNNAVGVKDNVFISNLKVPQVKRPDNYTCIATNSLGADSKTVKVYIKSPFELISKDEIVNAKYGEEKSFKCGVRSKVPAKITWWFKGNSIRESDKYLVSADGKELKIKAVDLLSQGEYTCVTTVVGDEAMKANHKVKVKIIDLDRPVLGKGKTLIKVPRNENVVLKCNVVKGNPKPIISWQGKNRKHHKMIILNTTTDYLQINTVTDNDAGLYKCIATNVIGSDDHTIEFAVQGPPIILSDEDIVYRAVVGDVALRIPCEVVGYPKPVITWTNDKGIILTGGRFEIKENALIINNPEEVDSKNYTCKAVNEFGSAQKVFEGFVTTYFPEEELSDPTYIYLERGETKSIKCNNGSLQGRWFKEWEPTNTTGTLTLSKVEDKDSGNYTCRISDKFGATSRTYTVIVGYRPFFDEATSDIKWTGRKISLTCSDVKPSHQSAEVEWYYNGQPSNLSVEPPSVSKQPVISWGTYNCKVSNYHGTATKTFKVYSEDCLLHLAPEVKNLPLILDPATGNWPKVTLDGDYWNVNSGQALLFSCHNQTNSNAFQKLPDKHEIVATCDHEDIFTVDGKKYKLSELQCVSEVLPTIKHTGQKCNSDNLEEINVGYEINNPSEFLPVYSVCYDQDNQVPVYSKVVLSSPVNVIPVLESWHESFRDKSKTDCDEESECCLGTTQLTNQLEVKHGAPQTATFIEGLNSVPFWHHCHNSTNVWSALEDFFARNTRGVVWSGAHEWKEMNGVSAPRYLWKMYKVTPSSTPKIVVRVNAKDPSDKDILCNTTCNKKIANKMQDEYTYCCSYTEFKTIFHLDL